MTNPNSPKSPDLPKPVLLIVDDQPVNIQGLYREFSGDYQVFMATNGEAALKMCKEKQPDLILLDVEMPGMDGYEVCQKLKDDITTFNIPIIFVTAQTDDDAETRGLDAGAVDYVSKPFNPKVVRARVKTHITIKRQTELLQEMVFVDGLTGLYNRRFFDDRFESEFLRSKRMGTRLSLLMIDVDDFKRYNDHYGHPAGDDCLRKIAQCLKKCCKRPGDIVARYGGEEFVCLLPDTPGTNAFIFAQLVEMQVRNLAIEHLGSRADKVATVSIGVASVTDAIENGCTLISSADAALYKAKLEGRSRAVMA